MIKSLAEKIFQNKGKECEVLEICECDVENLDAKMIYRVQSMPKTHLLLGHPFSILGKHLTVVSQ